MGSRLELKSKMQEREEFLYSTGKLVKGVEKWNDMNKSWSSKNNPRCNVLNHVKFLHNTVVKVIVKKNKGFCSSDSQKLANILIHFTTRHAALPV